MKRSYGGPLPKYLFNPLYLSPQYLRPPALDRLSGAPAATPGRSPLVT